MLKRMSVLFCVAAFVLTTAGFAYAQGDAAADAATTAAVKTKLLGDTKVGGLGIDVDTKDNVVTLTGKVRSTGERDEAIVCGACITWCRGPRRFHRPVGLRWRRREERRRRR